MVYTSDTGYSDELIEFAKGSEVLLMECSFFKNKPIKTHLELTEAMQIARTCEPQRLVLSHLYSEWDGIDLAAMETRYGVDIWRRYGADLEPFLEQGGLRREGTRLWLTRPGMLLANEVMTVFV